MKATECLQLVAAPGTLLPQVVALLEGWAAPTLSWPHWSLSRPRACSLLEPGFLPLGYEERPGKWKEGLQLPRQTISIEINPAFIEQEGEGAEISSGDLQAVE